MLKKKKIKGCFCECVSVLGGAMFIEVITYKHFEKSFSDLS